MAHETGTDTRVGPSPIEPSSLIGKTAWSSIACVVSAIGSLVVVVAASRILGPEGAGQVAYAVWAAGLSAQVGLLALPQAALRFLAAPTESPGVARWLVHRSILLSPLGVLGAAGMQIASGATWATVAATSALAWASMALSLGQSVLSGTQRYGRLATLSLWSAALQVCGAIVGCLAGGPIGCILGQSAACAPLLIGLAGAVADGSRPDASVLRRLRSYALHSWLASSAGLVAWSRLEFVFLKGHGSANVAVYAVALAVSQLGLQPATILGNAMIPHFGELASGGRSDTSKETFAAVTRVMAALSLPLCLGLAALTPALVPGVFGPGFTGAIAPAAILVAAASLVAIAPAATAVTYAEERNRYIATATISGALVAIAGFVIVIPRFGAIGAALVRATVQAGGVVVAFWYVRTRSGMEMPLGRILRSAAAAGVAATTGYAAIRVLRPGWPSLVTGIAAVALTYALLAPLAKVLERRDVEHLDRLLSRLPGFGRTLIRRYVSSLAG
jgi:O-antigen/teichoic acid export membrane protein